MKRLATCLFLPILLLAGCSKSPVPEAPPASTSPAGLSAEAQNVALQHGKAIVAETSSLLSSNLQAAIQQGGVSNALPFCSLAASPLTAGMAGKHGVTSRPRWQAKAWAARCAIKSSRAISAPQPVSAAIS